ncbi:peroxiredoxin-like family protein [Pseudomonadota bacterium]
MSKLQEGRTAPELNVKDIFGNHVSLKNYSGKRVLLSFYRFASCPFCNLRVHELTQKQAELQAQGLELIAVFHSPDENVRKYVGGKSIPFPIIADQNEKLYQRYGIQRSWFGMVRAMMVRMGKLGEAMRLGFNPGTIDIDAVHMPADFFIGDNRSILKAYYGKDSADSLSIEEIEALLKPPQL